MRKYARKSSSLSRRSSCIRVWYSPIVFNWKNRQKLHNTNNNSWSWCCCLLALHRCTHFTKWISIKNSTKAFIIRRARPTKKKSPFCLRRSKIRWTQKRLRSFFFNNNRASKAAAFRLWVHLLSCTAWQSFPLYQIAILPSFRCWRTGYTAPAAQVTELSRVKSLPDNNNRHARLNALFLRAV